VLPLSSGVFDSGSTIYLGTSGLLTNAGLLSPGSLARVLTSNVTGNAVQTSSGVYGLDLDFRNQTADRINVTGTANLAGRLYINPVGTGVATPGAFGVTVLSAAGGVTNSGLTLDYVSTAVGQYRLIYPNPNDVVLQYDVNFSPAGMTGNQHSVGSAVNRIQAGGTSPSFDPIARALYYQPTTTALGNVYNSLSGEGTASAQQSAFIASNQYIGAVFDQIGSWRGGAGDSSNSVTHADSEPTRLGFAPEGRDRLTDAFAALKPPAARMPAWRVWVSGWGGGGHIDGETPPGTARLTYTGAGGAFGIDRRVSDEVLMGMTIGTSQSRFQVSDRATSGTVTGIHVGGYGAAQWGSLYTSGMLMVSQLDNSTARIATVPGTTAPIIPVATMTDGLAGHFISRSLSGRLEVGRKVPLGPLEVAPFVAMQFGWLSTASYSETRTFGTGSPLGLSYEQRDVWSLPMFVGAQLESKTQLSDDMFASATLRAAWVHEFAPQRSIVPSFLAAPGYNFIVDGARAPVDALRVNAGAKLAVSSGTALQVNLTGDVSRKSAEYAISAAIKRTW